MPEIKIEDKSYDLPSSWDNMSSKQFVDVIRAFVFSTDIVSFKVKALFALLHIRVPERPQLWKDGKKLFAFRLKGRKIFLLSPEQLAEFLPLIDYLFFTDQDDVQSDYIVSQRTINPIQSFKRRLKRFYGPADRLFNSSFEEFIAAEMHYMNFLKDNNTMHIESLIASLYRPEDPGYDPKHFEFKGDRREPFNDHLIEARAKSFQHLNIAVKYAIFYWYQGCREFLTYQFPHVFNGTSSNKPNPFGMMVLVDALAQNDVTRNEQIRKGLLYDVLLRLEQSSIQREEMESKLSKNK